MARLSKHKIRLSKYCGQLWLMGPKAGDSVMHFSFGWYSNIGPDNIGFQ